MSYKIEKPEGAPDWFMPGIKCRVWDNKYPKDIQERVIIWYQKDDRFPFRALSGSWQNAEPIEQWEPKEGEYCAFWDERSPCPFWIGKYNGRKNDKYGAEWITSEFDHIARIKGVDCACSLEELKTRTDWL